MTTVMTREQRDQLLNTAAMDLLAADTEGVEFVLPPKAAGFLAEILLWVTGREITPLASSAGRVDQCLGGHAMTFPARFPGRCAACDERIHEGDPVTWDEDAVVHEACVGRQAKPAPVCERCHLAYPLINGLCEECR